MPDVHVHTPLRLGGSGSGGSRVTELTTLLSTPTLTDMFKKEEEPKKMEPVLKRSPTTITNSRSSNSKKLRRVSFIDLTDG